MHQARGKSGKFKKPESVDVEEKPDTAEPVATSVSEVVVVDTPPATDISEPLTAIDSTEPVPTEP